MTKQFEHFNYTDTNNMPNKTWDEISASASEEKRSSDAADLNEMIENAIASGKEEFNVDKALMYYYPNDITDDEVMMKKTIIALESDYYYSNARTIEDWARQREQIKAHGDS